jgi:thiol:disulfide interchange protein DsbD
VTFLRFLACLAGLLPGSLAVAADLLGPEQAFRVSAQRIAADEIEVHYRIAEGYYLYRDKFRFSLPGTQATLERPQFPPGLMHEDEFFGKSETYRGEVRIRLSVAGAVDGALMLHAVSQGCADAGICYPPQTQDIPVDPAGASGSASTSGSAAPSSGLLASLRKAAAPSEEETFLPVDKAFTIQARMPDATMAVVRFAPAEGYYLYRDKTTFAVKSGNAKIESVQLPRGEMKKDPNFGDTEVFHRPFQAIVRVKADAQFVLEVRYQGCSEKGLCYPPEKKTFALVPPGGASSAVTEPPPQAAPAVAPSAQAEDQRIARLIGSGNFWLVVASFLGFGLLLSATPCMWPMIPILSGIIAGQAGPPSRSRGFSLAAAYVLGMALAYAAAGVAAGMTGSLLSSALQNAWVLGGFALVFVALALSMFGLYDLQLPASWQSRFSAASGRLRGGTLAGVFLMGVLSAVIVGPCVAAPLAGALLYISQTRDTLLGGSALFAMALGMGLPLLAIGTFEGALLPRAGPWMRSVKNLFGALLLASAIWVVSPVIPVPAQMLLWAALLIVCAIYLRAIDPLPADAGGVRRIWKGVGILALLLGIAFLVGALTGGKDVLRPLAGLRPGATAPSATPFVRIGSVAELDAAVAAARGRPTMLDFYADWCVSCKEMEHFTFSDERVRARMQGMLLLQADVTANNANDKALLARFGLFGPPGIIFFDARGQELRQTRVIGFMPAERFAAVLDSVAAP